MIATMTIEAAQPDTYEAIGWIRMQDRPHAEAIGGILVRSQKAKTEIPVHSCAKLTIAPVQEYRYLLRSAQQTPLINLCQNRD